MINLLFLSAVTADMSPTGDLLVVSIFCTGLTTDMSPTEVLPSPSVDTVDIISESTDMSPNGVQSFLISVATDKSSALELRLAQ